MVLSENIPLPKDFYLPSGEDYDDLITGIDDDIREEGGPGLFLGMVRFARKNNYSFHKRTLYPLALRALSLEEVDERGVLVDRRHSLANAALSGMIFGHLINESSYPLLNQQHYPYKQIVIHDNMLEEAAVPYHSAGGVETARGRQIGFGAMAAYCLNQLSHDSIVRLYKWSHEVIDEGKHQESFVYGLGLSLYASWDLYGDRLIEEGREKEVVMHGVFADSDSGND